MLGVHDVFGAHLREHGTTPAALVHVFAHPLEMSQRLSVPALLQVAVSEPLGVVVGSPGGGIATGCELVLRHHLIPHPQGDEDVGGHVMCVCGVGSDLGVRAGRGQTEGRVDRVVVAVDQQVRGARVVRIVAEHRRDDGRSLQVRRNVPHTLTQAQERCRVEYLCLAVGREARHQALHGARVGRVAPGLGTVAVQDLDGIQIRSLPGRGSLGAPGLARRAQTKQARARGVHVLLVPEGMGVRQRLAPIRQGEPGIDALCLPEGARGVLVLEAVQQKHAADERGLSGGRARRGKINRPEALRLRRQHGRHQARRRDPEPPHAQAFHVVTILQPRM